MKPDLSPQIRERLLIAATKRRNLNELFVKSATMDQAFIEVRDETQRIVVLRAPYLYRDLLYRLKA